MARPPSLALVLNGFDEAVVAAAPLEAQLRNAYHRELNRLVKEAARRFARHAITASATPSWQMPNEDEILPHAEATQALAAATDPIRVKLVSKMIGGATAAVGVSFDVQNPLAQTVLSNLGQRITNITDLTRAEIMASLDDSFSKGLSIPHTARAMASKVGETNVKRAALIARTEFIGAQNGSSLAAVQYTGAAKMKTWLATNDNRTRADHADASGQTVPLSEPFDVGGFPMQHPGDQNAPPEEVCNCRCTMTYTDEGASAGPSIDFGGISLAPSPATSDLLAPSFAKHPVGSTRAYYKNGNGYKLGTHEVVEHNVEAGTITIKSPEGELKSVKPHELKKPNKAKLGTTSVTPEPVTTSPLVQQSQAAIAPVDAENMKLFPDGSIQEHQGEPVEVLGHGQGLIHVKDTDGLDYYVQAKDLETGPKTKLTVHPAGEESKPAQAIADQPKSGMVVTMPDGEHAVIDNPSAAHGLITVEKVANGEKASFLPGDLTQTSTGLKFPGPKAPELKTELHAATLEGKSIIPGDIVYDTDSPVTIQSIDKKLPDGHYLVTVSEPGVSPYQVSTSWLKSEPEKIAAEKTSAQLESETQFPVGTEFDAPGGHVTIVGHEANGDLDVDITMNNGGKMTHIKISPDSAAMHVSPATGKTMEQLALETKLPIGSVWKLPGAFEYKVVGYTDKGLVKVENLTTGFTGDIGADSFDANGMIQVKGPVTNAELSSTLPAVGDEGTYDGIPVKVVLHPSNPEKIMVEDNAGNVKSILVSDFKAGEQLPPSTFVPTAKTTAQTLQADYPVGKSYEYNPGKEVKIIGHNPDGSLEIETPKGAHISISPLDVPVTPSELFDTGTPLPSTLASKVPLPPVGSKVNYEGVGYKVISQNADSVVAQNEIGQTVTLNQSHLAKATFEKPEKLGTLGKPHAPVDGTFQPITGDKVTFDSAFEPETPYHKIDNPTPPIGKGKGTIVSIDWDTNQVMVNVGTKAKPKFVQTHLSKIRDVKTGKSVDWKVGGGKPGVQSPQISTSHGYGYGKPDVPPEFLPVPKPLPNLLDSIPYRKELAHEGRDLDMNAISALREYSGSAYRALNNALRDKSVPALAKQLDRAFDQIGETEHNGILHRYTNLSDAPSARNLQVGQVIHDDGFVSTTTSPGRTSGFGSDYIIIEVPKGARVVDLNALNASLHESEHEILINRGARMVVTKIENVGGRRQITARLIVGKYKPLATNPNL